MESLVKDMRYGIRSLLKRPAFTLVAVITLAVGIGANTAIFSMVNALLVKPLPFSDLDRIVALWDKVPSRGVERNEVTVANFLDWRAQNQSFEQLAIYRWWSVNLTGGQVPERLQGFLVTANFLDAVGVKPILGRTFAADEDQPGKDAVAILSYGLWQRRFGGDANVIIVNETLAHRFWPNTDPIGKRMRFAGPLKENPWMQVVGVAQDVKHELNLPTTPDYYRPHAQDPWNSMVLVAHTKVDPLAMAAPMREQVWAVDKDQPVFEV